MTRWYDPLLRALPRLPTSPMTSKQTWPIFTAMSEVRHAKTSWWFWTVTPRNSACTRDDCNTSTITAKIFLMGLITSQSALFRLPDCRSQVFQLMMLMLSHGAFSVWTVTLSALPALLTLTHRMARTVSIATESTKRADGDLGGSTISSA